MRANLIVTLACLWLSHPLVAATASPLTAGESRQVVEAVVQTVADVYIDAEKAAAIRVALNGKLAEGGYAVFDDPHALATQLSTDLLEISRDLHFNVLIDPDWVRNERRKDDPEVAARRRESEQARARHENHGLRALRRLEGNVGYLRFDSFADPEYGYEPMAAAMRFLAHSDAVILDLRYNNGGYLEMAQVVGSYFLSTTSPQMLYDYDDLLDGKRVEGELWVLPAITGHRMPDTPLYVLTSRTSFSAAEWLAFVLKNLGRATVIGERTAGGAHPVNRLPLNERFVLQVPTGQVKDGVRGEDFEGVGVVPDVAVAAHEALPTAHRAALEALMAAQPEAQDAYAWFLPVVAARLDAPRMDATVLDRLVGPYGTRFVERDGDTLYYRWNGDFRVRLLPLDEQRWQLEGVDDFRLRFAVEGGRATGFDRVYQDGRKQWYARTSP